MTNKSPSTQTLVIFVKLLPVKGMEQFASKALSTLVTTAAHWRMAEDVRALDSPLSVRNGSMLSVRIEQQPTERLLSMWFNSLS
jgi:hypothetical protein